MIRVAPVLAAAFVTVAAWGLPARAEIDIQVVTSPGGLTAWLFEEHSIPIVTLEAEFSGGTVLDPEGREGAVALMTGLLEEGAGDLDATGFAEAREALAARFGFDAGLDGISVSAEMLTENRDASLDLLRSALAAPRFDPDAIERVQAQLLSSLRSDGTDPDALASRAFYAELFEGHPYARPQEGTVESVSELGITDIRAAHAAGLTRDGLKIAVVGDITAEDLGPLLDRVFGDLPAEGPSEPPTADVKADGGLAVVDLDVPQSVVIFGHRGIPRDDPDFIPAFVMDEILGGGGFGSRLTEEVREKRGLTYGIYTWLAPNDHGWLYMGRFSSANARVAEAIGIVRAEWARMAEGGVTETELDAARRYLTGAYPLRYDGNSRIARQLLGLQLAGLGVDYVNERNALVEAVTSEDIARIAARMLDPDNLTFMVVGRPEELEPVN